ncbi:MAG: MBL fold metallo-hydrolase [Flavitalea sp.]
MKLAFHGAARTVTGSKHLLTLENNYQILLDCGMFQGLGSRTYTLNANFGFDPEKISVLLLSHAHIDHSGLIPKLVKEGFKGKIYCTAATKELTEILLEDSAHIQSKDKNNNHHPHPSLYEPEDVNTSMELFEVIEFDKWFNITPDISVLYTRTGHLIGAAAIHLRVMEDGKVTAISFSADVGRALPPLLKPATDFPQAEYIILESTYGDRHHEMTTSNIEVLLQWIKRTCVERKGKLIIPAFSVGRTQELLYLLNQLELEKRLPELSYFVDSPLSLKATESIKKYMDEFNDTLQQILKVDKDPFVFNGLKYIETVEDSIKLSQHYNEPCVILSASGTGDAGRVRHHIEHAAGNPANAILFSGYCSDESLGGILLNGAREIEVYGKTIEVNAEVGQLKGLSAHGDSDDLCNFVSCQDPGQVRKLFLVHGEFRAQEVLARKLSKKNFHPVVVPNMHEEFQLNISASV